MACLLRILHDATFGGETLVVGESLARALARHAGIPHHHQRVSRRREHQCLVGRRECDRTIAGRGVEPLEGDVEGLLPPAVLTRNTDVDKPGQALIEAQDVGGGGIDPDAAACAAWHFDLIAILPTFQRLDGERRILRSVDAVAVALPDVARQR